MTCVDYPDQTAPNVKRSQIGKPLPRTDAPGKVFGSTRFAGDHTMPGMLHMCVVRANVASAILVALDVEKARALKGVVEILTAADMPTPDVQEEISGQDRTNGADTESPILAAERIRYYGEPLALIAAESRDIAEQARQLVEFELKPVRGVYDPLEAMKPGAPVIQGNSNIVAERKIRKGDAAAALENADFIIENTFRTPFQEHAFLEPEAGLAWVDENDVVNIRVCTQDIAHFRAIADAIGVPHNKVRIRGALVGGGFGGKEDCTLEKFLAVMARKTGRPVRLEYSREDSFVGHGKRHPLILRYKTGVMKDGTICGLDVEIIADSGAYLYLSPYVLLYAAVASPGPYRIDNLNVRARAVATNNMYTSAFRGYGAMQACAAYEQQMEEVAKVLEMDPIEFRRLNYLRTGDPVATGFVPPGAIWTEQCVDLAWKAIGGRAKPAQGPVKIGRGIAAYQQSYGRLSFLDDSSEAWVGVELDGTVIVRSGVADIGAGQVSALCQIAAEILGVSLDKVTVYSTDSAVTPMSGRTAATRTLYMTGNATKKAAEAIRTRLTHRAAQAFDVRQDEIEMADGTVAAKSNPGLSMSLGALAKICRDEGISRTELAMFHQTMQDNLDPETGQGQAHPDYVYGAHAVEVSVDTETGEVCVLRSIAAHDIGQCINRAAVEGQIEGGAQNGQGFALSEEMLYEEGRLITPSLSEYLMPTSMDMPRVESIILESRSGIGPFGAKGIGEPAITPVAPAVANAIADAIGVRVYQMPITPERIVNALAQKRQSAGQMS
ncbi:xanthine dehydrogenase family protein molybdopterin-binding subunit [Hoeflea sp. TYP-13]|uniref:xanthine dehydrogenase family protein molybdopterin-binding subunit n=1 Tax=Hoeflea sp. TYP-13 TaxID=3230023 RepID=UPI0034C6C5B1